MSTKAERAAAETERQEYAAELRNILPPHATIYTTEEYTSTRSTTAHVGLYVARIAADGHPFVQRLTYSAARAMGVKVTARGGLSYGGYGYSKTFQAVYGLGRALFPDGYTCTGDGCRSNDHTNGSPRDGAMHHADGGYYYVQSAL